MTTDKSFDHWHSTFHPFFHLRSSEFICGSIPLHEFSGPNILAKAIALSNAFALFTVSTYS